MTSPHNTKHDCFPCCQTVENGQNNSARRHRHRLREIAKPKVQLDTAPADKSWLQKHNTLHKCTVSPSLGTTMRCLGAEERNSQHPYTILCFSAAHRSLARLETIQWCNADYRRTDVETAPQPERSLSLPRGTHRSPLLSLPRKISWRRYPPGTSGLYIAVRCPVRVWSGPYFVIQEFKGRKILTKKAKRIQLLL